MGWLREDRSRAAQRILTEQLERSRQVRGLLLLAVAAILFDILRAGVGWWRIW